MNWNNVDERKITCRKLWAMAANLIKFIVGATYDVLSTLQNHSYWVKKEAASCVWVLAH